MIFDLVELDGNSRDVNADALVTYPGLKYAEWLEKVGHVRYSATALFSQHVTRVFGDESMVAQESRTVDQTILCMIVPIQGRQSTPRLECKAISTTRSVSSFSSCFCPDTEPAT